MPGPGHGWVVDRPMRVHCPKPAPAQALTFTWGLVDEPPGQPQSAGRSAVDESRSVYQHRGAALDPPKQRRVIHLDAGLGGELIQVPARQAHRRCGGPRSLGDPPSRCPPPRTCLRKGSFLPVLSSARPRSRTGACHSFQRSTSIAPRGQRAPRTPRVSSVWWRSASSLAPSAASCRCSRGCS